MPLPRAISSFIAISASAAIASAIIAAVPSMTALGAQSAPTSAPMRPADCRTTVAVYKKELMNAIIAAMSDSTKKGMTRDEMNRAIADKANSCSASLSIATTTTPSDLIDLASLYRDSGKDSLAFAALDAAVQRASQLPDSTRAPILAKAVEGVAAVGSDAKARATNAERYLALLDALGPSVTPAKMSAHASVERLGMGTDNYTALFAHSRAVIALAQQLSPAQQANARRTIVTAYSDLAYSYGNKMHPDSALALLRGAQAQVPGITNIATDLAKDIARYTLVGTRAANIGATHWLNGTTGSTATPAPGKVTVIEFTAHWCGPCRSSYPTIVQWDQTLRARGLHTIFAAQIEGSYNSKALTPDQEVAANRAYFVDEHKVTFPVAFQPETADSIAASAATNWSQYHVQGIPQIVVIDRQGIIRQIVVGWDVESDATISPVLNALLSERSS